MRKKRHLFASSGSDDDTLLQSNKYTDDSSSLSGLSRTSSLTIPHIPPPIDFDFRSTVTNLSFTASPDIQITDTDDLNPPASDHSSFRETVLHVFRRLTIQFNTPGIELTPAELFSLCIGLTYVSSTGTLREIRAMPGYFQRVSRVMEKYCIRADKDRFTMPPLQRGSGLATLGKHGWI